MREKNTLLYWFKLMITGPDRLGMWEEFKYIFKHKTWDPRCLIGAHKLDQSYTWYYEPDWYCTRCDEQDAKNLRWRYLDWASLHTMHPFAWPFVIYASIHNWWWERTHNEDGSPK